MFGARGERPGRGAKLFVVVAFSQPVCCFIIFHPPPPIALSPPLSASRLLAKVKSVCGNNGAGDCSNPCALALLCRPSPSPPKLSALVCPL